MQVKLISVTPDAEKIIAYCARVSSQDQSNPEISKLLKYCIKHGHWSIFETGHMTVEIETSRAISAQLLRHRSFTFQEFSQRYQEVANSNLELYDARRQDNKNRQNSIDDLSEEVKLEWERRQEENWTNAHTHYEWAINNGIAKECARMVLPLQTSTKLYMTGSIRSWIHYLSVRSLESGTQKEHADIAEEISKIFANQFPIIFEAVKGT